MAGDPLGDAGAKGWAIATARPLPGSRPFPLSLTNYSLAVDNGTVQTLATGQAQWLLFGLPLGGIEAGANLGIELYDVVTVDQMKGRVVGIFETWERGRLSQRLALAEVDGYGVSVGLGRLRRQARPSANRFEPVSHPPSRGVSTPGGWRRLGPLSPAMRSGCRLGRPRPCRLTAPWCMIASQAVVSSGSAGAS